MRRLPPTILVILAPVFACSLSASQFVLTESGSASAPSHGRTWLTIGILLAILALGALTKARISRRDKPAEGKET
jgi:hypothetical protein